MADSKAQGQQGEAQGQQTAPAQGGQKPSQEPAPYQPREPMTTVSMPSARIWRGVMYGPGENILIPERVKAGFDREDAAIQSSVPHHPASKSGK